MSSYTSTVSTLSWPRKKIKQWTWVGFLEDPHALPDQAVHADMLTITGNLGQHEQGLIGKTLRVRLRGRWSVWKISSAAWVQQIRYISHWSWSARLKAGPVSVFVLAFPYIQPDGVNGLAPLLVKVPFIMKELGSAIGCTQIHLDASDTPVPGQISDAEPYQTSNVELRRTASGGADLEFIDDHDDENGNWDPCSVCNAHSRWICGRCFCESIGMEYCQVCGYDSDA